MVLNSQTTTTTLTNVFYHLVKYPQHMKALQSEVDKVFDGLDDDQFPDYQNFSSIPYLEAIVNETLRLLPVATGAASRVTPPEGIMIDGEHIPGDILVYVPQWTYFRGTIPNPIIHTLSPSLKIILS